MLSMTKTEFESKVKSFRFKEIFNFFGWDNDRVQYPPIEVDDCVYMFKSIAQKSGFRVVECTPLPGATIPGRSVRNRIESKFSQMSHDHIIIFTDSIRKGQVWQFVYRTLSQGTKRIEVEYDVRMNPEKIYERASGLVFGLDEEDHITIIDVIERVRGSLVVNAEKVTKKFYDHFRTQRKVMIDSIVGIDDLSDKEWYASLMINRLMFCYFIQKRRFLDNDMNYLNNKLADCKKHGVDGFYSFYKNFLLVLFHDGLSSCERNAELIATIGNVPYLNGGLFDVHSLERKYPGISIPDETFEKLFAFFDKWDWHLDSNNISSSANEINPDVLGYIFEKYINDRAKLGAYYTKEDITDYMAKSSIIPAILDKVQVQYPIAFEKDGTIWSFLRNSGDTYIFEPVKHGIEIVDTLLADTTSLSSPAPEGINTGKETWRDVINRKAQYERLVKLISDGGIDTSDDFVAENLDICSFIYDLINTTEDYGFLYAFYGVLKSFSVLDPTCGSGAFLLAALNILEPLYEGCLSKFEYMLQQGKVDESTHAFVLDDVSAYSSAPNKSFWIQKRIIANNLYGVDIISEAVETSKLRLFLKLMACVEPNYAKSNMGVEPLPDMDYNIRSGNSLNGYISLRDVNSAFSYLPIEQRKASIQDITIKCTDLRNLLRSYRSLQFDSPYDIASRENTKRKINKLLGAVNEMLNKALYHTSSETNYDKWFEKTKPFHWIIDFLDIMDIKRGFDAVIGNPPYVKNAEIEQLYSISQFKTYGCGNVYTCFAERATSLSNQEASLAMILQLPIVCTDGMEPARKFLFDNYHMLAFATFDDRPGKLFDELQHIRVAIILAKKAGDRVLFTTSFNRWYSEVRSILFEQLRYYRCDNPRIDGSIPKIGDPQLNAILRKLASYNEKFGDVYSRSSSYQAYYHNAPLYWIRGSKSAPYFWNEREGEKTSSQYKAYGVNNKTQLTLLLSVLNSSLFYMWFVVYGDMRHLNRREIDTFPICRISGDMEERLTSLLGRLMQDYEDHKTRKECIYKSTGLVKYDEYHPKHSKPFMDLIDAELAKCYGLSPEETDYVINYDLKYRMGGSDSDEADSLERN